MTVKSRYRFLGCVLFGLVAATGIGCGGDTTSDQLSQVEGRLKAVEERLNTLARTADDSAELVRGIASAADVEPVPGPSDRAKILSEAASGAFAEGDEDSGYAYLAAAAARDPSSPDVLSLLLERGKVAVEDGNADEADIRLATLRSVLDAGIVSAMDPATVDRLMATEKKLAELSEQSATPASGTSPSLEERLATLETASSSDDEETQTETALRVALATSERLVEEAIIASSEDQGSEADEVLARAETLRDQLGERLEVLHVHRLTAEADTQTRKAASQIKDVVSEVQRSLDASPREATWEAMRTQLQTQSAGQLSRMHPLSSADATEEFAAAAQDLARLLAKVQAGQSRAYNQWAIDQLQTARDEYAEKQGFFNDDETAFRSILIETLGPIDTAVLHPAVGVLYGDLYQTILSELSVADKVRVTRGIEAKTKRGLADF